MPNNLNLAELTALWEASTQGEWSTEDIDGMGRTVLQRGPRIRMFPITAPDAICMAALHNAFPQLAARIAELERDQAARDEGLKRLGAAEWLERMANTVNETGSVSMYADWMRRQIARLREGK